MDETSYIDDPTILDEDKLLRRIFPDWVIKDDNSGKHRISSAAFQDSSDGTPMSVSLEKVLSQLKRDPNTLLANYNGFGLASITAGLARECKQGISRDKRPEDFSHALVFGEKTRAIKRRFSRGSSLLIFPSKLSS